MGLTGWWGVPKAGLEPDKEVLPDKETAGIKAIAGPYGIGGEPPDGDISPGGVDGENQGGVSNPSEPFHKTCHIKVSVPISEYP